ncbi:hypothetical protein KVF89_21625 [Nocardioides carbamazepini]|uniref:hypothetical protein n=1 Tax=Nocardioides carbamazepini TaxID=2854259 RepID=UPI00214A4C05|nr:hypothetical protein [Nocardioides carbamazepini]MCR1785154.1 hypothetical protein [Nocardioides carbamazepini]
MSDLEGQLRAFLHEGEVPVPDVPDLVDRVAGAQRRHRRRRVAGVVAAACLIAAAGIAGTVLRGGDSTPQPATPGPSCAGVTLRTAGVSTVAGAAGPTLALVLGSGTGGDARCPIGPGTRIEIGTGADALSTTIPHGITPVRLRPGRDALLQLTWTTWCGDGPPQVRMTFSTGETTTLDLPAETETPPCATASDPAPLRFVALRTADVMSGGRPGPG